MSLEKEWSMMENFFETFADHINYIRGRIGIDRIGLGGDFDGINR